MCTVTDKLLFGCNGLNLPTTFLRPGLNLIHPNSRWFFWLVYIHQSEAWPVILTT